jgi:hypothetical protein
MGGAGEVEADPGGREGEDEHRYLARLEAFDHRLASFHRGAAVQELGFDTFAAQVLQQEVPHLGVLGEHE